MVKLCLKASRLINVLNKLTFDDWSNKKLYLIITQSEYNIVLYSNDYRVFSITVSELQSDYMKRGLRVRLSQEVYNAIISSSNTDTFNITVHNSVCTLEGLGGSSDTQDLNYSDCLYNPPYLKHQERVWGRPVVSRQDFQNHLELSKRLGLDYSFYVDKFYTTDETIEFIGFCWPDYKYYRQEEESTLRSSYVFPGKVSELLNLVRYFPKEVETLSIVSDFLSVSIGSFFSIEDEPGFICLFYYTADYEFLEEQIPKKLITFAKNANQIVSEYIIPDEYTRTLYSIEGREAVENFLSDSSDSDKDMVELYFDERYNVSLYLPETYLSNVLTGFLMTRPTRCDLELLSHSLNPYQSTMLIILDRYGLLTTLYVK